MVLHQLNLANIKKSKPGLDGLTWQRLHAWVHFEEGLDGKGNKENLRLLTFWINQLNKNKLPAHYNDWLSQALLIPLQKPNNGGIRPIAMSNNLPKLVSKCNLFMHVNRINEKYYPNINTV